MRIPNSNGPQSKPSQKYQQDLLHGQQQHQQPNLWQPSEPLAALALATSVLAVVELLLAGSLARLADLKLKLKPKPRMGRSGLKEGNVQNGTNSTEGTREAISDPRNGQNLLQEFAEQAAIIHNAQGQWISVSMLKSLVFALLLIYLYLTSAGRRGRPSSITSGDRHQFDVTTHAVADADADANLDITNDVNNGFQFLNSRPVFAALFFEMMFWAYTWTVLKEERGTLAAHIRERILDTTEEKEEEVDEVGEVIRQ